jgi:hypothetical protein
MQPAPSHVRPDTTVNVVHSVKELHVPLDAGDPVKSGTTFQSGQPWTYQRFSILIEKGILPKKAYESVAKIIRDHRFVSSDVAASFSDAKNPLPSAPIYNFELSWKEKDKSTRKTQLTSTSLLENIGQRLTRVQKQEPHGPYIATSERPPSIWSGRLARMSPILCRIELLGVLGGWLGRIVRFVSPLDGSEKLARLESVAAWNGMQLFSVCWLNGSGSIRCEVDISLLLSSFFSVLFLSFFLSFFLSLSLSLVSIGHARKLVPSRAFEAFETIHTSSLLFHGR